jgi:hypothetical protein
MLGTMERISECVVSLCVRGKTCTEECKKFTVKIEEQIRKNGKVRCLVDLTEYATGDLKALFAELKIDAKMAQKIERCAIICEKKAQEMVNNTTKALFAKKTVRTFEPAKREQAVEWIQEGIED